MKNISFVYPNVTGIPQRGDLLTRWKLGEPLGCSYVEMPADLIKNKTESRKTNLELCDFLTPESIKLLYDTYPRETSNIKYILHSEPSLSRTDGYGISKQARLQWFDNQWLQNFTSMLVSISKHIGHIPEFIEIHPGDRRNSIENILDAVIYIREIFQKSFNKAPIILLENRTQQFITTGNDLKLLWDIIKIKYEHLMNDFGIVLDIQQLYTSTKQLFIDELFIIPTESIRGLHIHRNHRVPKEDDPIPWQEVFNYIKTIKHPIFINPEIHHKNQVGNAIAFCTKMWDKST